MCVWGGGGGLIREGNLIEKWLIRKLDVNQSQTITYNNGTDHFP